MNFIFKGIRNIPIKASVRATYFRLRSLFGIRGSKWSSMLESRQLFNESFMKFIKKETSKGNTHAVTIFDRCKGWLSVQETMDHNEGKSEGYYQVKLNKGWCDYGKFQAFRLPSSHAIVACSYAR